MDNLFAEIPKKASVLPVYLTAVGGTNFQLYEYRENGYPEIHFLFCVKGKGKMRLFSEEYIIEEDSLAILMPNEPHEYFPLTENWQTRWIVFSGKEITSLMATIGWSKSGVYKIDNKLFLTKAFNELYSMGNKKWDVFHASCIVYTMLTEATRHVYGSYEFAPAKKLEILEPVISFIIENYQRSISVCDMADCINVSPQYLCKLFLKIYNMRPFEYLNMVRIRQAKELLSNTEFTVGEIALKCGFNNTSYFCLKFKGETGISPLSFAKIYSKSLNL